MGFLCVFCCWKGLFKDKRKIRLGEVGKASNQKKFILDLAYTFIFLLTRLDTLQTMRKNADKLNILFTFMPDLSSSTPTRLKTLLFLQ